MSLESFSSKYFLNRLIILKLWAEWNAESTNDSQKSMLISDYKLSSILDYLSERKAIGFTTLSLYTLSF